MMKYEKPGIMLEEKTDAAGAAGAVVGIILAIIIPTASDKRLNSELVEEYKEAIEE